MGCNFSNVNQPQCHSVQVLRFSASLVDGLHPRLAKFNFFEGMKGVPIIRRSNICYVFEIFCYFLAVRKTITKM